MLFIVLVALGFMCRCKYQFAHLLLAFLFPLSSGAWSPRLIWGSLCNSRHPGFRRVWRGGPAVPHLPPHCPPNVSEFHLDFRVSIFVRGREGLEPYPSKPLCPPHKFDTLKTRGFVYAERLISTKLWVSSTRNILLILYLSYTYPRPILYLCKQGVAALFSFFRNEHFQNAARWARGPRT